MSKTLRLVEGEELEVGALVFLEAKFDLNEALGVDLQRLNAGIVLPDEALQLGRPVRQFRGSLGKDLVRVGFVHVVGLGSASLGQLVSLDEGSGEWIVLFELEVARSLVIAQCTRHGQVLRSRIEHNSRWLTVWRAHIESTHVYCVVSARQGHLQLQIVLIVLGRVGNLGHQLFLLRLCLSFSISRGGDTGVQINLGGRVDAQVLIHARRGLHKLYIFLIKFAWFHRFTNVLSLYLPKHTEVVFVNFFYLDLLIVLIRFLQIFKLDMRHIMLLELNSYYFRC